MGDDLASESIQQYPDKNQNVTKDPNKQKPKVGDLSKLQRTVRNLVEESFSSWIQHKMPKEGTLGLWKMGVPMVNWLIGDLDFIFDDSKTALEFKRLIAGEINRLWTTYMMECYTAFLEYRVASDKEAPSLDYPTMDHKIPKWQARELISLPCFECESIPPAPNLVLRHIGIKGTVKEIFNGVKMDENIRLSPHSRPPEAIIQLNSLIDWNDSETITILKGNLDINYPSMARCSTLAEPIAKRICQVFFLQLQQMHGGRTSGALEAVGHRHFPHTLMCHGKNILDYQAIFQNYANLIGWDVSTLLKAPRTQNPESTIKINQATVKEFKYIPATLQSAKEDSLISLPRQNAWVPFSQNLTEFLLRDFAEESGTDSRWSGGGEETRSELR